MNNGTLNGRLSKPNGRQEVLRRSYGSGKMILARFRPKLEELTARAELVASVPPQMPRANSPPISVILRPNSVFSVRRRTSWGSRQNSLTMPGA